MPRGDKSKYTDKQKRKARHIEEGYEQRGVPEDEAERRAWATVNKETGGGNKSGAGYERLRAQRWTHRREEIGFATSGSALSICA
jgi:plasmid stabilization system protein ParE